MLLHRRFAVTVLPLLIGACAPRAGREPPTVIPDPLAVVPPVTVPAPGGNVTPAALLRTMDVRAKIGQLVFPWMLGDYSALDAEGLEQMQAAIDSFQIGGLIVSTGTPMDAATKLNALQRRSILPLLVTADLEFGTGMRFRGGTAFPVSMAIGATGSTLDAYELGRITAIEARALGVHLTFSPVADVNNNPDNPIINTRSFGEDPRAVSRLVEAYVRGAEEHGLRTTAKHFPGHGDTGTDSHIAVPVAPACWSRLDTLELAPFRAAIRAGTSGIMTAHVALPCIDRDGTAPATMSPTVMTGILRDSLGFHGLVVTDALVMGAIVEQYGAGASAVRAFLAGSDVLLMPADIGAAVEAMEAALTDGRITMDRLDASVTKILALKERIGLFRRRTVPLDSIPAIVGRRAFQDAANDMATRALTLVQRGSIDAFRTRRGRTAVIAYAEETNLSLGNRLVRDLRELGDTVSVFRLYPASGAASYDSARAAVAAAPRAIFASSVRPIAWRGHVALPDPLAALIGSTADVRPTMLVSFGSPYLLNQLPGFAGGYLLAWGASIATERAVARALAGAASITGTLPITLSDTHPRGTGIRID